MSMLGNYFKVALRNLLRHKVYSAINILSLALGMAGCMIIAPQVIYHFSFDRFNHNYDRICRVLLHLDFPGQIPTTNCGSFGWVGRDLKREFPEVENFARIYYNPDGAVKVRVGEKEIESWSFCYSENSLFDLFSFPFEEGDPASALSEPTSLVLTRRMATRLFGDSAAMGRTVTLNGSEEFKVTGVLKDLPGNSHLHFDLLAPLTSRWPLETLESYRALPDFYTYLLLAPGADSRALERKISAAGLLNKIQIHGVSISGGIRFELQPLSRVHLYSSHIEYDNLHWRKADITYTLIFIAVALLMLVVACINFINLATARSAQRSREVGVRKVVGANRSQLVRQFLCESVLVSLVAVLAAQVLIELSRPLLEDNLISGPDIPFTGGWSLFLLMTLVTVGVGLLAGWYPALFLSLPRPQEVLKGSGVGKVKGLLLRRALVVVQFAAAIFLIVCSLFILKQLRWVRSQNLGYDRTGVLTVQMSPALRPRYESVRSELLATGVVEGVCAAGISPLGKGIAGAIMHFEGQNPGELWLTRYISVDPAFIPFFGLQITEGRAFSDEMGADTSGVYVINETLKKKLGWDKAVGKTFWLDSKAGAGLGYIKTEPGRVIGVVKDFHFNSLHTPIEPLAMVYRPSDFYYVQLRLKPEHMSDGTEFLERTWKRLDPASAFSYWRLDGDLEWQYNDDRLAGQMVTGFTVLCVLIACLGLLGLVAMAAERRTKEIGVRKVLGASVGDIILLLSREFLALLGVAILIAWPAAWWVMRRWLESFAYRTSLDWWTFALAGVIALAVAAATVSFQATRAASADPVRSLRYE
ncbi:ABC transporter permease [bacterium]|nr:ABC transporter permease [bacterium]